MTKRTHTHAVINQLRKRIIVRRLASYVRGEQSADARRETARLIDRDESIYAEFRRIQDADRALSADLAPHGRADNAQLDRAFANIGAALNGSRPLYSLRNIPDWRTSLIAVFLAILLIVPGAIGLNRVSSTDIPTQPQPRAIAGDNMTPTSSVPVIASLTTMTPELATAKFITRATPTAPESE